MVQSLRTLEVIDVIKILDIMDGPMNAIRFQILVGFIYKSSHQPREGNTGLSLKTGIKRLPQQAVIGTTGFQPSLLSSPSTFSPQPPSFPSLNLVCTPFSLSPSPD